jgi:hypothetical protein
MACGSTGSYACAWLPCGSFGRNDLNQTEHAARIAERAGHEFHARQADAGNFSASVVHSTCARIEVCRNQMRSDSHAAVADGAHDLQRVLSALCDIAPMAT